MNMGVQIYFEKISLISFYLGKYLELELLDHMVVLQRKQWNPTPVLLTGKSHGRRTGVGYSPCVCKELDTTEYNTTESSLSLSFW